ncbi:polysaccharide deacetylase family protein [bacterium]|nr:polysaccharide deacetylase family protein [bacterium]
MGGARCHGAQGPFHEADLHLDRGEQREHIGLGQVANWGGRHVRQCIPRCYAPTMKSRMRTLRPLFMVAALVAALIAPASASGSSAKQVALTFDDGDSELHIRQAVAIAVATQTPITFFPTGKSLRKFPNLWKAIGDAGIPIANHTVNHVSLTKRLTAQGRAGVVAELGGWVTIAKANKIPYVKYWRPPGGAWNNGVRSIAQSLGLTLSMWTNTFADTAPVCKKGRAYSRTASSFKNATKANGDKINVLGHVNPYTAQTVKLLAAVIENYAGRGFQFVTVPELETGVASNIDWAKAALAVSAPAKAGGARVPTGVPTPIDPLDTTYTFAQANGITCR